MKRLSSWLCLALGLMPSRAQAVLPPTSPEPARKVSGPEHREDASPDWAGLKRYREANARLGAPRPEEHRVVFFGDSITEAWIAIAPGFFEGRSYHERHEKAPGWSGGLSLDYGFRWIRRRPVARRRQYCRPARRSQCRRA